MRQHSAAAFGLILGCATAACAQPVFFATTNHTLYRFTANGAVETFQLSDRMMSLAVNPAGEIVGHSAGRDSGNLWESYRIDDAFGTPTLSMLSNSVQGPRPTLSFADGQAYSTREDGNDLTELITVDNGTLEDSGLVGNTGLGRSTNGSGYDPVNDVLYMINGTTDTLYSVSRGDGTATAVGGLGLDYFNGGADFLDGTLYAVIQDTSRLNIVFGTIDTGSGAFSPIRVLDTYDPNETTFMALAAIPAPASAALLGLGGLLASRRRR